METGLLVASFVLIDLFNMWFLEYVAERDWAYWIFCMLPIANFLMAIRFFIFLITLLNVYKMEQKIKKAMICKDRTVNNEQIE